jgi:hypothetical protein
LGRHPVGHGPVGHQRLDIARKVADANENTTQTVSSKALSLRW